MLYGSRDGLRQQRDQLWTQATPGGSGKRVHAAAEFGSALAIDDFSRDGAADLAVGVPGRQFGPDADAGAVAMLPGHRGNGLLAVPNQLWRQNTSGIKGISGPGDRFGAALATGDFDADGASDLAIGAPGDNVSGFSAAGVVNVLFGSATGLSASRDQLWSQASTGIKGAVGNDSFGVALSSADPTSR